jgi:hypothetical protein
MNGVPLLKIPDFTFLSPVGKLYKTNFASGRILSGVVY